MRRRWLWVAVAMILTLGLSAVAWAAGETYKGHRVVNLVLGGKKVVSDVPPIIFDDRTLLPVRALTEALGNDVQWDGETYTATVVPRPSLDWAETAGRLRLHLQGIQQQTAKDAGDETLAGRLVTTVLVVNDSTQEQAVDLSRLTGVVGDGSVRTGFVLPHVLEVTGDRRPAPGTNVVKLGRGERVTVRLGYDLKPSDVVTDRQLQFAYLNNAGQVQAAMRIKIRIIVDCSPRPCRIIIIISL